ncbi:hypothetical protein TraAM80_08904 [Trypanosoma rangeli]|uniref:Uncharacterized protein n=1 Tax=Trypanosoma rangeli TaxID=5698 RepID=A0A3R7LJ27_TRYRA|nr:uncharacterized protein TraAM80_08904 [Trypanosoma rangeli]RNE98233.1 hypothetical protein TraAM80_08904 [Trypanosoma rangeli]|eukprot:RNE98233.1 hypothetical protein TraAM80_08904 [Trypanosoma rangeli]
MRLRSLLLRQPWRSTASAYARHGEAARGRRHRRASHDTASLRDSVGMLIPEAFLRRDRVSPEVLDRSIEKKAHDLLALGADAAHEFGPYGAEFDRRDIRFQGKNGDLRQFAEMAARAASVERWSGTSLQGNPPLGDAVAFVGGKHQKRPLPSTTADTSKDTLTGGSAAMLQRVVRRHGGDLSPLAHAIAAGGVTDADTGGQHDGGDEGNRASVAGVKPKLEASSTVTEGKRRVERRQRRLERIMNREGDVHPCVHQGGCVSQGGAAMCPFVLHPATVCVAWLRHGCCEDAVRGSCPWWHGGMADTGKTEVVGNRLFCGIEDANDGDRELLCESCAWMGTILQMFLDLVVTTLEDARFDVSEGHVSAATVRGILEASLGAASSNRTGHTSSDMPLHYDPAYDFLSVDKELALSALMSEEEVGSTQGNAFHTNVEKEDSFDVMLSRELASSQQGVEALSCAAVGDAEEQLHATAERRLRRVLASFRGYVCAVDVHEGPEDRISLCTPLTQWLLQRVADDYQNQKSRGNAVEATPQSLFEEASITLLRTHLRRCGVDKGGASDSLANSHRWSGLLLLQLMSLLTRLPASREMFTAVGCMESSFLYTALLLLHIKGTPSWSADNVQTRYMSCWVFFHSLISTLALGLVRESIHQFTLARSALVGVVRQLARGVEDHFSMPLLRASGWSAWTDEQMFASQRMQAYTAVEYARFHLPATAHCFLTSVLNTLMLHVLREAMQRYQLRPSPVASVLFSGSRYLGAPQESLRQERCLCGGGGGVLVRRGVQPYALEAVALLSCLHDENNAVMARRQQLMEEFMTRRADYHERAATELARCRKSYGSGHLQHNNGVHPADAEDIHVFEKLLPHASVMVSADVLSLLLPVLFLGGGAYKALRLASSAIHASRMLRHAAKQPIPYVVQGEKTIHKRVRHGGTGRKHLIRLRVPVLRRVDAEVKEQERSGVSARPVGLYMQLGERVVAEIASMGVRMGAAGAKLVRGVCEDSVRGLLVDYAEGRCLPAPDAADVHDGGTITAAFGARALRTILSIAGVGSQCSGGAATFRRGSSHAAGPVILERRIPPTALLLETVVALTPTNDREAHTLYERICSMDQRALVTDRVLLAQHYHAARRHFGRAAAVASAVWLDVVRAGLSSLSRPSTVILQHEVEQLPASVEFGLETLGAASHPLPRERRSTPRTVEELRDCLEQSHKAGAAGTTSDSRPHGGYTTYVAQCLAAHFMDAGALQRMRWAVLASTLLAVRSDTLTGKQRVWSRLLLRNTFILALQATSSQERERDLQATVRVFLLSDLFHPIVATVERADEQGLVWCSAAVRDLPRYLAAQTHLAEQLHTKQHAGEFLDGISHGLQLLPRFRAATSLHDTDATQTNAWCLLEPFLQHTELAITWLRKSFLEVPPHFLLWITAHVDVNNSQTAFSLAAWSIFLHSNHAVDAAVQSAVLQATCKKLTPAHKEKLQEWLHIAAETSNTTCTTKPT